MDVAVMSNNFENKLNHYPDFSPCPEAPDADPLLPRHEIALFNGRRGIDLFLAERTNKHSSRGSGRGRQHDDDDDGDNDADDDEKILSAIV